MEKDEHTLVVENVVKDFGKLRAVDGVSMRVKQGEILSIIGPNGAGKTTFINLITGGHTVSSGRIAFQGDDITNLPAHKISRKGISRSFQVENIFGNLTVFENVRIAVLAHRKETLKFFTDVDALEGVTSDTRDILAAVGLDDKRHMIASTLSHGDQRSLEIGIALASVPSLLLLDEPTAGMSPEETKTTVDLIRKIAREQGLTVLFTEHDLKVVFSISERIIVLQQGSVIADGTGDEIRNNKRVIEAYLGEEQ